MKSLHWLPLAYLIQIVCAYARRSQRNQSFVSNGHNNTDFVIAGTSSASFRNDDRIRHPSHQENIWKQSFFCCWTLRALPADIRNITDLSSFKRAIKTLSCIGIFRLILSYLPRRYHVQRFWTIFRGVRCAI